MPMRLEIPEHKILVHQLELPIQWGDMDALGHVNNTVYFRYMEQARVSWIQAISGSVGGEGEGRSSPTPSSISTARWCSPAR